MLREHVERVARDADRLDRADLHALGDHRRLHQIAAVLRKDHASRDRADLVAGPTDALQPARDARWALDLDDEVDRAHVDAEFEGAGGDDRGQLARLQHLLGDAALLAADRAVMGSRDFGLAPALEPDPFNRW